MIYDIFGYFSAAQAPTTGTTASTNVIDTGVAGRSIGSGEPVELVVQVATTCTSGGANTTQFVLQDSADNSSFANVVLSDPIAVATLVAGYEPLRIKLPAGLRRYVRVAYVIATANLTAGAFNAFLTHDRQEAPAYASGFAVS